MLQTSANASNQSLLIKFIASNWYNSSKDYDLGPFYPTKCDLGLALSLNYRYGRLKQPCEKQASNGTDIFPFSSI
eukprot:1161206-Pelagomonas_calceolata.AAC.11